MMDYSPVSIGKRIAEARERRGLSQAQLADLVHVTQPTVSDWETGETEPRRNRLDRLASSLGVDIFWLQFGTSDERHSLGTVNSAIVNVPLIDWVQAGGLVETSDPYQLGAPEDFVPVASTRQNLIALRVRGDSTDRAFPEGTIVIVDLDDRELVEKRFFVFRHQGKATLKMYRANPSRLEPHSTNPDHDPIYPTNGIEVVGRVILSQREHR